MGKDDNLENIPQKEPGIGDVLKAEREKKGLSKRRLAEMIKVRENVIDAIENEDWNKLPARVFIKGFIRSYAISVDYDQQKAFRLFDKSMPGAESTPRPLTDRKKKGNTGFYLIIILLILAGTIYYLTAGDKSDDSVQVPSVTEETPDKPAAPAPEDELPEQVKSTVPEIPDDPEESEPDGTPSEAVQEEETSEALKEESEKITAADTEIPEVMEEAPAEDITPEEEIREEAAAETESVSSETAAEEPEYFAEEYKTEESGDEELDAEEPPVGSQVLKAIVKERTYVKMIVDNNEPKEYVFQPGRTPQWTAEKGFVVKLGNAGGIEFNFNGKTYDNIGRMGRVKTVRFPEDFYSEQEE